MRFLVLILLFAACDRPEYAITPTPGVPLILQIDASAGAGAAPQRFPVVLQVGDVLTEWIVYLRRDADRPASSTARLQRRETVSATLADVGPPVTNAVTCTHPEGSCYVALQLPGCSSSPPPCMPRELVSEDGVYSVLVESGGGADHVTGLGVYGVRP